MIRKLEKKDEQIFLRFSREFYRSDAVLRPVPDEYHLRAFDELMRSETYAQCYLLCDGETPVGYALTAKTYSREAGGAVIWIEEIYISPESRGKGLGKQFFAFLETLGAARLRLEAEPRNGRAIGLYRALGYRDLPYAQLIKETEHK